MTLITENIIKAADCAAMAWDDLQDACRNATPLEQLHLEQLLKAASETAHAIARFRDAITAEQ
jgi:phage-related minor tail protein